MLFGHVGCLPADAQLHPYRVHKPVLGSRYSDTVSCWKAYSNPAIFHMNDGIHYIGNDIAILGYSLSLSTQEQ